MFTLANIIIALVMVIVFGLIHLRLVIGLYLLAVLVPGIAVRVRRLHDIDMSGWFVLLGLIPLVNIWLIVLLATEGTRGPNQYGADPKAVV